MRSKEGTAPTPGKQLHVLGLLRVGGGTKLTPVAPLGVFTPALGPALAPKPRDLDVLARSGGLPWGRERGGLSSLRVGAPGRLNRPGVLDPPPRAVTGLGSALNLQSRETKRTHPQIYPSSARLRWQPSLFQDKSFLPSHPHPSQFFEYFLSNIHPLSQPTNADPKDPSFWHHPLAAKPGAHSLVLPSPPHRPLPPQLHLFKSGS